MKKTLAVAALAAITFGAPLAIEQAFTAQASVTIQAKGHGHGGGGHGHHKAGYLCDSPQAGYGCNGNIPSYDNPNCWPNAIYCPPADSPPDDTVTDLPDDMFPDPDEAVYAIGYRN